MDDEQDTTSNTFVSNETLDHHTSSTADAAPTIATSSTLVPETHSDEDHPIRRMIQNFFLIWVDPCLDRPTIDYQDIITQLECIFSIVYTHTNIHSCVDFLSKSVNENVFLIVSSCLSKQLIPLIHRIPQLEVIYIHGDDVIIPNEWSKVKGVYSQLIPICEVLKQDVKQCNRNNISVSFVPSNDGTTNQNLNQLDPSFMYTQIFKEILLSNEYDHKSIENLVSYCRQQYDANRSVLNIIAEFEREYRNQWSIRWYTRPCFIYDMLNQALRNLEADTIIKMGFFINDLHRYIKQLYLEQKASYWEESFIVYRGQGLSESDFNQLIKSENGLISFNSFLSTSIHRSVSLMFAESNSGKRNTIGILFKITTDPSISPSPFARIDNLSYCFEEGEVLFSMHAVFRISKVQQLVDYARVWQVDLKLTSDEDQQLSTLTKQIQQETSGSTGYERLGKLLIAIGQLSKAEELYQMLLDQTVDTKKQSVYYQHIGNIKDKETNYGEAISFYKKALEIEEKLVPVDYFALGTAYTLIGAMYMKLKDYPNATSMHITGVKILHKIIPSNHPDLVNSYIDTGRTSSLISEHMEALLSHEEALRISEKTLPTNHPHLAASYNNIGVVYHNMGDSSKALLYYEKTLEIFQKTLPENHPFIATSLNNIAAVYKNISEYSKALSYYEKSLAIRQRTLPANHPEMANSYTNIGMLYEAMGEYSKALSYQEKSLEIRQKSFSANHPDLAICYTNIGVLYQNMGDYSKALSFQEKSLEIRQQTLSPNHPEIAISYANIGSIYQAIGEYSKALSYQENSLEIRKKTLPSSHSDLANSYNNLGTLYQSMFEYSKALNYYEKALEIRQGTLRSNHADLANSYANIGIVYQVLGENSKALSYQEKALTLRQRILPANHPDLAKSYANIGIIYQVMGECSKAFSYHEQSLEIRQKTLPSNHPDLAHSYIYLGRLFEDVVEPYQALSLFERAATIFQQTLPSNHPDLQAVQRNIELLSNQLHITVD